MFKTLIDIKKRIYSILKFFTVFLIKNYNLQDKVMILMNHVIQEQAEHKIDLVVVGQMRNRENLNPCLILERELSWRIFWIQLQGADLQGRGLKGALIPDTDPILIQDRDSILILGTEFILNPDRNPVWIQD